MTAPPMPSCRACPATGRSGNTCHVSAQQGSSPWEISPLETGGGGSDSGQNTTPDKANWPAKWDEQHKVHVPFCYLGANGTTVWSIREAASIWIRCEACDAPCEVSPGQRVVAADVVAVGGCADTGERAIGVVAHGSHTACTPVDDDQGGSALL